jgi:hypothetical protein
MLRTSPSKAINYRHSSVAFLIFSTVLFVFRLGLSVYNSRALDRCRPCVSLYIIPQILTPLPVLFLAR